MLMEVAQTFRLGLQGLHQIIIDKKNHYKKTTNRKNNNLRYRLKLWQIEEHKLKLILILLHQLKSRGVHRKRIINLRMMTDR
jgi:hypothetical protein